eukprot:6068944-Prymnesium_polylepis.1
MPPLVAAWPVVDGLPMPPGGDAASDDAASVDANVQTGDPELDELLRNTPVPPIAAASGKVPSGSRAARKRPAAPPTQFNLPPGAPDRAEAAEARAEARVWEQMAKDTEAELNAQRTARAHADAAAEQARQREAAANVEKEGALQTAAVVRTLSEMSDAKVNELTERAQQLTLKASLCKVVANGDVASARQLLEAGADPNEVDATGHLPLHRAAMRGDDAIAALLLQHGACAVAGVT